MQGSGNGKKVFVGLSGGVDSSVSAALLKRDGYDVTGVFIKVWQPDFFECTWREDRLDAMRVCAALNIPFKTLDLEDVYEKEVIDYLVAQYAAGQTPNPDVMCNRHVKFGAFLSWAKEQGADFIATGHYARNRYDEVHGKHQLLAAVHTEKDQSYFLWTLTQETLSRVLFPVGALHKPDVRKLAENFDLPTAHKRDSQGLCFIGELNMQEFLEHFLPQAEGKVLDVKGTAIGHHRGALFYTRGQRHGFTLTSAPAVPHYVIDKDMKHNTVTVGTEPVRLESAHLSLAQHNWISGTPNIGQTYLVRTRYRQALSACKLSSESSVQFLESTDQPSTGQSLVVYEREGDDLICRGGGILSHRGS